MKTNPAKELARMARDFQELQRALSATRDELDIEQRRNRELVGALEEARDARANRERELESMHAANAALEEVNEYLGDIVRSTAAALDGYIARAERRQRNGGEVLTIVNGRVREPWELEKGYMRRVLAEAGYDAGQIAELVGDDDDDDELEHASDDA